MRTHEVVALNAVSSSSNAPGEFLMVAVTSEGRLVQRSGLDFMLSERLQHMMHEYDEQEMRER